MITTMELKGGRLQVPVAIVEGFELRDGDLVEVALIRAYRRGGKVVELEPGTAAVRKDSPPRAERWEDLT